MGLLLTAPPAQAAPTSFGSAGTAAGQFSEPHGAAVDQSSGGPTSGDIYLADSLNNRVDAFGPEGEFKLAFGWGVADGAEALQTCTTACFAGLPGEGAGQFNRPEGLAVDNSGGPSQGDLYVADTRNLRVEKFSPAGEFLLMFGAEVDKTTHANLCTKADLEGGDVCGAGVEGTGPGQFEALGERVLAVDSAGTVYVGERDRVEKFGEDGVFAGQIALPGAGLLNDLAIDSAGDLYVIAGGLSGVHKYDGTGIELGSPRDELGFPRSLAIGPADELFLDDGPNPEGHHILAYDPSGKQLSAFDATGAEGGGRGIAYGQAAGALYVLNAAAVRIVTPPPPGPLVLEGSESATAVATTTATLHATIDPEGPEATNWFFEYGTEAGVYGQTSPIPPAALGGGEFEDQSVSSAISGLQPRTTYHYRVVATNAAAEVTKGPDQEFTTLPPVSIDSTSASQVTATSARLEAELNPHGLPTTYHFEYDTAPYTEGGPAHGTPLPSPDASAGEGTEEVSRSALAQGLAPATTYHFRVVAHNALGTETGPERSFATQGTVAAGLLDGRGWEQVSPSDKNGIPLEAIQPEGADIQAAADGSGLAYVAKGPISPRSEGSRPPAFSQQLAHRAAAGGWTSEEIATAHQHPAGVIPGHRSEYQLFSSDLSLAAVEPEGATPLSPLATEKTPYLREPDGTYTPLLYPGNVPTGAPFGGVEVENSPEVFIGQAEFTGATPDLSHLVLTSPQDLTEPPFAAAGNRSLYEWSAGALTLASQVPAAPETRCGGSGPACLPAAAAGRQSSLGNGGSIGNVRHAVSSDGSRLVFETKAGLWLRDLPRGETVQLDAAAAGCGTCQSGGGVYQDASTDGSRVFFTDERRLTPDSGAVGNKADLYMCQIEVDGAGHLACALTDLTANTLHPAEPADVQGAIVGASADGSVAYFVAQGALTPGAVKGNCPGTEPAAEPGQSCNLYRVATSARSVSLIAVLSGEDYPDWFAGGSIRAGLGQLTARVTPDGRRLAFMSSRPLTGYDNRDARTGVRDLEVFLYHAPASAGGEGRLICASCNPSGARPVGVFEKEVGTGLGPLVDRYGNWHGQTLAASIPGWTNVSLGFAPYQSRYLSNSGRLFFNAADALLPQDSNGLEDVYEYEPPAVGSCTTASSTYDPRSEGCLGLVSSGTSGEESAFLDASESGNDVFFLTASRLAPTDVDGALDAYDAHVCTAEAPCPPPPPPAPPACSGDACQQPAVPPNDATPGSLTFNGAGNLKECAKGKQLKKGKCVKKAHKKGKKHKKKSNHGSKKKSADKKKGGGK
ncbi:MAG TPA: hypothetical protein VHS74_12465 [Solirubrobacterales bacterium]|jgi:hypothetical protein|nr:hypothetical protein [Solirubrobacterales bacterium]